VAGIKIALFADVKSFLTGISQSEKAVEDVSDSLDDMAKDAAKSGDKAGHEIAAGIEDGTDDATKSVDKLERSFKDLADAGAKSSKDAGDGISDNVRRGTKEAEGGVEEFGREADSTAKETAASFDGSAESITGAFQEIAANAFAGFGPAGAVAGLAAAAGIGIVTSKMEEAKEEAQETAENIAEVAGELIDLGSQHLGPEQIRDALNDMATTAEDGKIPLDELRKIADRAGISYSDYAQGVAGDSGALKRSYAEVRGALGTYQDGLEKVDAQYGHSSTQSLEYRKGVQDQVQALFAAENALLKQDATLDRASETAQNFADASAGVTVQTEAQTAALDAAAVAQENARAKADAYSSTLQGLTEPAGLYADAMTAVKTAAEDAATAAGKSADDIAKAGEAAVPKLDDVLAQLAAKVKERDDFETNLKNLADRGFLALSENLKAQGPEAAGAVTALLAAGTNDQVQQYSRDTFSMLGTTAAVATSTGLNSGASQAAVQSAYSGLIASVTPGEVPVGVKVDTSKLDAELAKPRWVEVGVFAKGGMAMV
jgi:hypothetical protein